MSNKIKHHYLDDECFDCAGLKWMRTNLGAKEETDYGFYYPFGRIIGSEDASECKFSDSDPLSNMLYGKSEDELKAMGIIDGNGNLTPEYDAVTQALGNGWRMPTKDEFQSLIDNTDSTWEINFNDSGVNGRKFTLKDGSDYLFIPASGVAIFGSVEFIGCFGVVWSSTVSSSNTNNAHDLGFSNGGVSTYSDVRFFGYSVRGVSNS